MADRSKQVDVIIVGAGLSGLMAALTLQKSGKSFIVLEAQSRVGGRVFTSTDQEDIIEYGAQFVSPHQTRIQKLIYEYGISTTKTYNKGTTLYAFDNKKKWSHGHFPLYSLSSFLDYLRMQRLLKKVLKDINPKNPWESSKAKTLDAMTMNHWLENEMSSKYGKTYYRIMSEEGLCVDSNEISVLEVLWNLKSTGSLEKMLTAENEWITGGAVSLPLKMAKSLEDHVFLNEPVVKVEWDSLSVRIWTRKGYWIGSRVIMAVPPPLLEQIKFEPPLPKERNNLFQSIRVGCAIKCVLVYETPFWRKQTWNGISFYNRGPVKATIDITPPNQTKGMLAAFIIGSDANRLGYLNAEERKEEILECLSYLFGAEARNIFAYYEKDWSSDPWSRGGYGAHFAPGTLTQLGETLCKPIGPIHFAGTETATQWRLYMEGALEAGERAAFEVIHSLGESR